MENMSSQGIAWTSSSAATVSGCVEACSQCMELVRLLPEGNFSRVPGPEQSTIGAHLRHCVDHFQNFFRGLVPSLIDYDSRDRDLALETSPQLLLNAMQDIIDRLNALSSEELSRSISIKAIAVPQQPARIFGSTIDRELLFLASHTIHHLALVRAIAAGFGVPVANHLGVAFSTLEYRATNH